MQILYIVGKQKVFYNMRDRKIQVKKQNTSGSPDKIQRNARTPSQKNTTNSHRDARDTILQGKVEDERSTLGRLQIIRNRETRQEVSINITKET